MVKVSREVKIGLSVLIIALLFVWGFNFLQGKDVFNPGYKVYGLYNRIDGLTKSSPIYYKGFEIGAVRDIEFMKGSVDELVVTMGIAKPIQFPKNSVAQIYSVDLMGSKAIRFIYGDSEKMLEPEDTINTGVMGGLADKVSQEVLPLKDKAENLIVKFDSLLTSLNLVVDYENRKSFKRILSDFQQTIQNFDEISTAMNANFKPGGALNNTLSNLDSFSYSLKSSGEDLSVSAKNMKNISGQISDSHVDSVILSLRGALKSANELFNSMQNGEGTIGKLVQDETLYENLNEASVSLDRLLNDVREQPKRYINLSVMNFAGGKSKKDDSKEVIYKVLIEKSKDVLSLRDKEVMEGYKVKEDQLGKYYIYTVGEETDYEKIKDVWLKLLELYPDSKIIALENGKEVSVKANDN